MADFFSDVATALTSTDPSVNVVESGILEGRFRIAAFSYDTGTTDDPATGEVVQMTKLPAGARVWGIYLVHDALSSAGGTAGADIGDTGDPDRFVAAFDMDAASTGVWVPLRHEDAALTGTKLLGIGYKYTNPTWIDFKVTGEQWADDKRITGFVLYSVE